MRNKTRLSGVSVSQTPNVIITNSLAEWWMGELIQNSLHQMSNMYCRKRITKFKMKRNIVRLVCGITTYIYYNIHLFYRFVHRFTIRSLYARVKLTESILCSSPSISWIAAWRAFLASCHGETSLLRSWRFSATSLSFGNSVRQCGHAEEFSSYCRWH